MYLCVTAEHILQYIMNNINDNLHCIVSTSNHMQSTCTLIFLNQVNTSSYYLSTYKYTIHMKNIVNNIQTFSTFR